MNTLKNFLLTTLFVFMLGMQLQAQALNKIAPKLLNEEWPAKWITCPDMTGEEYGVYLFRKTITLDSDAEEFIIHISADNRYKLYVNGEYIGNGPARGDFLKWYFETYDIAQYLKPGENIITAEVWNFSWYKPMAQFSDRTRFIIQGNTEKESVVNSDKSWKVLKDTAYSPIKIESKFFYVVGPGDDFNGKIHPWGWKQPEFDDSQWAQAKEIERGRPVKSYLAYGNHQALTLYPREIPVMEETEQRFAEVRRANMEVPKGFIKGDKPIVIPKNTTAKVLFDHGHLTNAYPALTFSKGGGSTIKLTYAESLFDKNEEKGNRNEIEDKKIIGNNDLVLSGGNDGQVFQTLWWRTFRYLEMEVTTKDEPLTINDFHSIFTGYPFEEKASFKCDNQLLTDIWNVGWRTQRLCAGETYFDCPYYEQLQYAGDTRIQALVSSYVSGDTRLVKQCISTLRDSHYPFGLNQSRYPSNDPQVIPTFSLAWTAMLYDYWMINDSEDYVRSMIPTIMDIMNWYENRIDDTGMLGPLEWWNFVDWVNFCNWAKGIPPGAENGNSAIISLNYVYTLQRAAIMLQHFGFEKEAGRYLELGGKIKKAVYDNCYDADKQLIADTPDKKDFSQHANLFGILTNTIAKDDQIDLMKRILNNKDIAPCSFYFRYYLTEALVHAGLANTYLNTLGPWKDMLDLGLTTFAEKPEPSRSDCHAWSSSPLYFFLSLVCGIQPNEPGFNSVKIEPNLGDLAWVESTMPHRLGNIKVELKKTDDGYLTGEITLPKDITGVFVWQGKEKLLNGGDNAIKEKL